MDLSSCPVIFAIEEDDLGPGRCLEDGTSGVQDAVS